MIYLLFLIATIIRFYRLDAAPYWYDEAFTGLLMRLDLPALLDAIAGDTHPPLYYLLVWLVTRVIGVGAWQIRAISAVFSVGCVVIVWVLSADYLKSKQARLLATALTALMPAQLWFAQEARMYSLLSFEFLLTLYCVNRRKFLPVAIGVTALLFTHNYGLFYAPVLFLIAAKRELPHPLIVSTDRYYGIEKWQPEDRARPKDLLLSFVIPGFLYAVIWLPVLFSQMQEIHGNYWIMPVTPGAVLYVVQMLFLSHATPEPLQALFIMLAYGLFTWSLIEGLFEKQLELIAIILAPFVLAVCASLLWQPVLLHRAFLPIAPLVYILLSGVITTSKLKFTFASILIMPILVIGLAAVYIMPPVMKAEYVDRVQSIIAQDYQPGDVVLATNDGPAVTLKWAMPDLQIYVMPNCGNDPGALSNKTRRAIGFQQTIPAASRVWFIYALGPLSTQCEHDLADKIKSLSSEVITIEDNPLKTLGIYLYEQSWQNLTAN